MYGVLWSQRGVCTVDNDSSRRFKDDIEEVLPLSKEHFLVELIFCTGKDKYFTNVILSDLSVKAAVRKAQQKAGQHSQISVWLWNK